MLPLNRIHDFISQNQLFQPADTILLAVSGGRDSVLMAHFFYEAGYSFGIAHCNFMLRGREAEEDELFTRKLAQTLNAPFFNTRFNTSSYAAERKVSIQMAARDLRYEWLEQVRAENHYHYIATAHHQNDTVETTLLNLVRGTGIAGLHGILPKRGHIIRPLLFLTRDEVNELAANEKLTYRDDASNFSTKYARNKLRIEVIPVLKELNPNLEATFETNSRKFLELEMLLKEKVKEVNSLLIEKKENDVYISKKKLKALKPQHTLVFELLKPFGFKETAIDNIVAALDSHAGLRFESPTHILLIDREAVIISAAGETPQLPVSVSKTDDEALWNNHHFSFFEKNANDIILNKDRNTAQFDSDKIIFPLMIRSWQEGDYFKPLGMSGKKKLSDFYIQEKIPLTKKMTVPVLENGNGDIMWIAGIRIDDRYKVTSNTKKVFIFELKPQ